MFLPHSRYAGQATVTVPGPSGRPVQALTLRILPFTAGAPHEVVANDQLDVLALNQLADGTQSWAVADANTALDARELTATPGRTILVPGQP